MIISQAQAQAGVTQRYRTARDIANQKAKVAIDQCEEKQTVIDSLDARVADLEVRLHHARQKEDELAMAEEAITTAKKHIESQRAQIAELRTKIKEAGQKTPSTENKRINRFLDELGLHDPIDGEEDQLRVVDSSAPSVDRFVPSLPVLKTCLGEQLEPGTGYNDRFPDSGMKSAYKPWRSSVVSKFHELASKYIPDGQI